MQFRRGPATVSGRRHRSESSPTRVRLGEGGDGTRREPGYLLSSKLQPRPLGANPAENREEKSIEDTLRSCVCHGPWLFRLWR